MREGTSAATVRGGSRGRVRGARQWGGWSCHFIAFSFLLSNDFVRPLHLPQEIYDARLTSGPRGRAFGRWRHVPWSQRAGELARCGGIRLGKVRPRLLVIIR